MSIVRLESPCSADALPLASDGDERTPWRCLSDARQVLTADLGRVMAVGMVIQRLGPYHWEFPRRLEIETSADGATWREARAGSVLGEVIEGAFADPRSVAVVLPFEPRPARFIRLRHRSFEAGIGWTVAELEVWSSRPES